MRGGDDNAVRQGIGAALVVGQDGVRDGRGGRVAVARVNQHFNAVARKHLKGGVLCRLTERVRVFAHVQRPRDALAGPVFNNGLRNGGNVGFVEG